jgi:GTP pyrophosphokinase
VDPRAQLNGRIKSIASISGKMFYAGVGIHRVLDIIGVRVIFQNTGDCYRLVNRLHGEFEVLDQEYDDYIAAPKPNGYQSIHTTVVSSCGFPVEIQIRTQEMHILAELGSASHMHYKKDRVPWMPVPPLPKCHSDHSDTDRAHQAGLKGNATNVSQIVLTSRQHRSRSVSGQ